MVAGQKRCCASHVVRCYKRRRRPRSHDSTHAGDLCLQPTPAKTRKRTISVQPSRRPLASRHAASARRCHG
jgi:hypothetical protein